MSTEATRSGGARKLGISEALFLKWGREAGLPKVWTPVRATRRAGGRKPTDTASVTVDDVRDAMQRADGNASAAARDLGIARATLYRRLNEAKAAKAA